MSRRLRPTRAASILGIVFHRRAGVLGALVIGWIGVGCTILAACGLDVSGLENVDASAATDATLVDARMDVVGDAPLGPDGAGSESSTAEAGAADAGDASQDAQAADARIDACGTVEICNDGIDNDCNGLVDCADPQCQEGGWDCTPAVPSGWSLVAYDRGGRPSCATGWGSSASLVEGPVVGGTSCTCSCGPMLSNPCDDGTAALSLGQNACGCAQVQSVPLVSDGGCNPIGAPIGQPCGPWGDSLVKPIGLGASPAPVACADDPQRPTITYGAQGESCTAQESAGAGCPSGGGCLPGPAPAVACIEAVGIQSCPTGFTQQYTVYTPSNVIDQRQCGSCGCTATPTGCSGATVTLYDDPGCTQNAVTLAADGKCDPLHGDPTDAGWFVYAATLGASACSGAATTGLDGGLLLRAPETICCP